MQYTEAYLCMLEAYLSLHHTEYYGLKGLDFMKLITFTASSKILNEIDFFSHCECYVYWKIQ